ncbi:glycosyltransferase [Aliarcobacter butzleri]|uniref:glycosyltransferase n=1 Tax=Aliarcobacter butzleri TaxID=28197 RepID=UPI00126114E3|nr:glycosyltransferase [Aliarcobacter butzleri]
MINITEKEIMKNWQGDISEPVVSICCITYNHEKYIEEAIDSFLMQETNFPFEIVVGEDFSTDNTRKIVEKYKENYPNIIKLIVSENNVGMQANGQRTMEACKGEYIAACEGDDYWMDAEKLQIQKDFLESNPEYIICYTDVEAFNENGIIQDYIGGATKDLTADELKKATPINTLTTMYRNIMKDKFSAEFKASKYGDLFIWSILGYYGKGKFLPQIKPARYRIHSGGVHSGTSQIDKYDNTLITYALLLSYHKKLGSSNIVEYFRQEILWLLLRNNFKNFLVNFLIRVKNKILRLLKNDSKN